MNTIISQKTKKGISVNSAFTLIELLITVAIVAILVTIGYPSYQQYVISANRAEAQQVIMDIANRQEEFLLNNRKYGSCCNDNDDLDTIKNDGKRNILPERFQVLYNISAKPIPDAIPPKYIIKAIPPDGSIQTKDNDSSCTADSTNAGLAPGELQMDSELKKIPKCRWK